MKIINQDITLIEEGIICHQVNTWGVMGSGLAKQIRAKFPDVFEFYNGVCDRAPNKDSLLGSGLLVNVNKKLQIANLFGQSNYGTKGQFTDYSALKDAFEGVLREANSTGKKVYVPLGMGCGLGGGSWMTVQRMIENAEKEFNIEVIVCRYTV